MWMESTTQLGNGPALTGTLPSQLSSISLATTTIHLADSCVLLHLIGMIWSESFFLVFYSVHMLILSVFMRVSVVAPKTSQQRTFLHFYGQMEHSTLKTCTWDSCTMNYLCRCVLSSLFQCVLMALLRHTNIFLCPLAWQKRPTSQRVMETLHCITLHL